VSRAARAAAHRPSQRGATQVTLSQTTTPRTTSPIPAIGGLLALGALLGAGGAAHAADCPPTTAKELAREVSTGDAAFSDMDEEGFRTARANTLTLLPCLGEGITPGQAAVWHRMQALGSFLDRDHAGAVSSFRSVLAASPGYALPESLAPDGHPLRIHFAVAEGTMSTPERELPAPRDGWTHVDGRAAHTAPVDRPYVLQVFDGGGRVLNTSVVSPGQDLPEYESRGGRSDVDSAVSLNKPLAITAGSAALLSGVFYLAARSNSNSFWDPATAAGDLDSLRTRTNTFGWLSAGAGVVALGTGAGAVFSGTW
jgi:hypothetical protein